MNNFNIFSVAGKILQDSILNRNQNLKNVSGEIVPNILENNLTAKQDFSVVNQILTDYMAELKVYNMEFNQSLSYMKDLLNLPQDFKKFLATIQNQNGQENQINLLLIKDILNLNSDSAVQKIFQSMADMSRKGIDTTQLKELLAMVSASATGVNNDFIKNVMLLYIPFLPLSVKSENLDWEIKEKTQEEEKSQKEDITEILISTVHFQNIRISLSSNSQNHIDIVISATEIFPSKTVFDFIKLFAKENNFTVKYALETIKQEKTENKQSVKIMSGFIVNSCAILILHAVVNFILNLDLKEDI